MNAATADPRKDASPIAADPDSDPHLDIAARHLAGPGGPSDPVARHVLGLHWLHNHNYALGQTFTSSPDHRIRIASGQLDPGARWRVSAAREPLGPPQWMVALSQGTPEEFITAITESLIVARPGTDWTGEVHPALKEGQFNGDAALDALVAAGWREREQTSGVRRVESPDHLARAVLRPNADPLDLMGHCALAIEAGPADAGEPYWQALFTSDVPELVTSAFVRALTDPAPLRRDPERMDKHLLAHAGYTMTEDGPVPLPPAYTDHDLDLAAAQTLSSLLAFAEQVVRVDDAIAVLADQVLPSTGQGPRAPTVWGELPLEQRLLGAMLALDLVKDSARYVHRLLGLSDADAAAHSHDRFGPDGVVNRPAWDRIVGGAVPAVPLESLRFTNEDLYAAAGTVAAHVIRSIEADGVVAGFYDQPIAGRSTPDGESVCWGELPDHAQWPAHDEVRRRFTALGEAAGELFAPGMPRPAPLVEVAPAHLAGPGHLTASAPAAPLLAAGWTFADALFPRYASPCGRFRADEIPTANGTGWLTVCTDPATGKPLWILDADERTPAEITTAVHQALAAPGTARTNLRYSSWREPLAQAGWSQDSEAGHVFWSPPGDRTAMIDYTSDLVHTPGSTPGWLVTGGDIGPDVQAGWTIEMTDRAPRPLKTALATALTRTTPVARLARQVPAEHAKHLTLTPLKPRPAAPAVIISRAAAARHRTVGTGTTPADSPHVPEQHSPYPRYRR
ncbi:DUF317 domain-containing protein [Kitasatospora sp. NA04385]|uniref:DUF317 domain-containing protein n=1 Tax=Kitasatospora sp. NA04385 TaxID=2742135 RepID=UPI0015908B8C|nr:DUF317 domain-containing protein [Kitasatospora sp. NA04385]QKW20649.1 DUF317 domain-containing protein [Kitasatospora sp. NA04385]